MNESISRNSILKIAKFGIPRINEPWESHIKHNPWKDLSNSCSITFFEFVHFPHWFSLSQVSLLRKNLSICLALTWHSILSSEGGRSGHSIFVYRGWFFVGREHRSIFSKRCWIRDVITHASYGVSSIITILTQSQSLHKLYIRWYFHYSSR